MDAVLKKAGRPVRLGEFETCPNWGPGVDTHRRPTRISLKGFRFHQFDYSVSWPTKVRNVSRLGSQIARYGFSPTFRLTAQAKAAMRHHKAPDTRKGLRTSRFPPPGPPDRSSDHKTEH